MDQNKALSKIENHNIPMSIFSNPAHFEIAQRMANLLCNSTIVPKDYLKNMPNCLIALEMASRLQISPLMVMQNLYVVNGRPAWSSQFIISAINNSGRFRTQLSYSFTGSGDSMECYAYATNNDGEKVVGPTISMKMAKNEGWLDKAGSKWKTMPEVMLRYRAASFFGRLYCPDVILGIHSYEEVIELKPDDYSVMKNETSSEANKAIIDIEHAPETEPAKQDQEPQTEPLTEPEPEEKPREPGF